MNTGARRFLPLRTALFVPGDRPDRIDRAIATAADAVIIDLEDGVSLSKKSETRGVVHAKLRQYFGRQRNIIVRVNDLESGFLEGDLQEVATGNLSGILLPKVERADQVKRMDSLLTEAEKEEGLEGRGISLLLQIESAAAVQKVDTIMSAGRDSGRLYTAAFGAADYCLDLGIELTARGRELHYPRSRIPVACRAAGLAPPLDTPFMFDLNDRDGLRADALRGKRLGFQGKLCVHPNQIEICNAVFSPTEKEIHEAEKVVRAFEEADSRGVGAIQVEGKLIDLPVVRRSRRVLALAAAIRRL